MTLNTLWTAFLDRRGEIWELFLQHVDLSTMAVLLSLLIGVPLGLLITKTGPPPPR